MVGTDLSNDPPSVAAPASSELLFDVQVLKADLEVIARTELTALEGESVAATLGDRFEVAFKAGSVGDDGRLRLEGFRIAPVSANKSRRYEADRLLEPGERRESEPMLHATLNLWLDQPLTLIVAQEESLVVAVTCRREGLSSSPQGGTTTP